MKIKFDDNLLGCADGLKIGYALIENLRIIKTSKEFDIELNSLVETIRKSYKNPAILYEDYRIEGIRLFLKRLHEIGCSYVYIGIESLSPTVLKHIHKYAKNPGAGFTTWADKIEHALDVCNLAGIHVGSSVLFGLPGETMETIEHTITHVEKLAKDGKLFMVSPNLLTYHPATPITRMHSDRIRTNFVTLPIVIPPYDRFEEANPNNISYLLTPEMIDYINQQTSVRWITINKQEILATK